MKTKPVAEKKREITFEQYLTVRGLLAMAQEKYNCATQEIMPQIAAILKVPADDTTSEYPYFGHVSDALYSCYTPDEMLGKLKITVKPMTKRFVKKFGG